MAELLDFESDQFLKLLTDALRAGPGSDEWRQAVQALRSGGQGERTEEYAMLCAARERLENGMGYRQVRAGPGFSRKVLAGIEQARPLRPRLPMATLIAVASLVTMAMLLTLLALVVFRSVPDDPQGVDHLSEVLFVRPIMSTGFEAPVNADWMRIGSLSMEFSRGLRIGAEPPADEIAGGGVVWNEPIPPEQVFAVEVTMRIPQPADQVTVQVFVTDQPQFSPDRGTSPRELVWLVRGGQAAVVLPDGQVAADGHPIAPSREPFTVRLMLDRSSAIIDSAGERVWSGGHELSADRPRHVGVRMLREGEAPANIVVQSLRVLMP